VGALLNVSVWVALATVVPGLVTMATIYGACVVAVPAAADTQVSRIIGIEWVGASVAVAIMVLTQAFGILLEELLTSRRWLGRKPVRVNVPEGLDPTDPHRRIDIEIDPYVEYRSAYILLAELRGDDDAHGHLTRILAQFFLTNNTLVSFFIGVAVAVVAMMLGGTIGASGVAYVAGLLACIAASYAVARIRFRVMAKALWAARRSRQSVPASGEPG